MSQTSPPPHRPTPPPPGENAPYAAVRHLPLACSVVGSGPRTVVFLHGLFGRGKNFQRAARDLGPAYRCLLVDLPDHGRSPWSEGFSYRDMAAQVAELIRADPQSTGPVDVVGHSMGGKVAMVLALEHPDLVDRLVVVDISPTDRSAVDSFDHLLGALAELNLAGIRRRSDADRALAPKIPRDSVRAFLLQNLRSTGEGYAWEPNLTMLRAHLPEIGGFPEEFGRSFDGPVLWLAGEDSDYVQPEHAPVMRGYFPRVRRMSIKGAGHWVHSEKPEEFLTALAYFLDAGR